MFVHSGVKRRKTLHLPYIPSRSIPSVFSYFPFSLSLSTCSTPISSSLPSVSPNSSTSDVSVRTSNTSVTPNTLYLTNLPLGKFQDIYTSLGKPLIHATRIWQATMQNQVTDTKDLNGKFLSSSDLFDFEASNIQLRNKDMVISKELISKDKTVKWLLNINHKDSNRSINSPTSVISDTPPSPPTTTTKDTETLVLAPGLEKSINLPTEKGKESAIEMVYIPEKETVASNGKRKSGRGTLCVSSQIGCSLACRFCHTGTQKLQGNLRTMDIVEQVLISQERIKLLQTKEFPQSHCNNNNDESTVSSSKNTVFPTITNIVFMGQGEPLLNYRNVSTAIQILTHPEGLNYAPRRITISTSGIAPNIPRIAKELPGVRLAISLHAPTNSLRTQLMNINQQYSIQQVLETCQEFIDIRLQSMVKQRKERIHLQKQNSSGNNSPNSTTTNNRPLNTVIGQNDNDDDEDDDDISLPRFRNDRHNGNNRVRISFEYAMLRDINDTPNHAILLAKLFKKHIKNPYAHVHVNLIPFNPWPNAPYQCSVATKITDFQRVLNVEGIHTTIRRSRGQDILGACGQLRSTQLSKG